LLSIDREQWQEYAGGSMSEAISLHELGWRGEVSTLILALGKGFEMSTGVTLERGQLSSAEQESAARLAHEKYANERWTYNGKLMAEESENEIGVTSRSL